eukprot:TRINITY_DN40534_c0_g1_i1.p1 TRINITY_DN40534_c0_g1~~TRINITY_DN40534_c0_g1_i1.p1  ORF type:complete len:260 (+),score=52.31 TRINITY_DN40534_c0_g1_i1:62-841(+)
MRRLGAAVPGALHGGNAVLHGPGVSPVQRRHAVDPRQFKNLTLCRRPRLHGKVPEGMVLVSVQEEQADEGPTQFAKVEGGPWNFAKLDEDTLGEARNNALRMCGRLEYQRLYLPDLKLPAQDDIMSLGSNPMQTVLMPRELRAGVYHEPKPEHYTLEAGKIQRSELFWGRDSIRKQLDGWDPKGRSDLQAAMVKAVPIPEKLGWDVQFPMWNPNKRTGPKPAKGYLSYLFAVIKGSRYQYARSLRARHGYSNVSYRGLA